MDLDSFFKPKSVAVIGASKHPRKFGHIIFENFIDSDYKGKVYAVNNSITELMGQPVYESVLNIPKPVDMAVIVIPAKGVPDAISECVRKKVKACVIISAGFGEIGNKKGEEQLLKEAKGRMRIIGPNVLGIYDAYSGVDTVFNPRYRQERPIKGSVGFISQSGAFGASIMDMAASEGIGISKFASIGNRIDVDEVDLLNYLAKDKNTKAIALYIEGSKRGKVLLKTLKSVTIKKPVVVIKAGKTTAGQVAVSSHTGSMAGESKIFSAVLKQSGAIEAFNVEELLDFTKALATQPVPKGKNIQVVTNGGGFGVIATDSIIMNGLKLAQLSRRTIEKIKKTMPSYAQISNPMDLVGDADSLRYQCALENVMKDSNVHGVVVIMLMQISALESDIVDVLISVRGEYKKPMTVCATGGDFTKVHTKMLEKQGIPTYATPDRAVMAMKALVQYADIRRKIFRRSGKDE